MTISRRDFHRRVLGGGAVAALSGLGCAGIARVALTGSARAASAAAVLPLVDPELRDAARAMLAQTIPPPTRANLARMRAAWTPPPPAASPPVVDRTVPGPPGAPPVAVEVIGAFASAEARAGAPRRPAILHIHGGGMISGRARNMTAFSQSLAETFDAVVVNVDYRLAPETPWPGPVLDNVAALEWMVAQADELGIDPARIAVMGESAGGGLAALVGLMARDRGKVRPCLIVMLYPMLDDRTGATRPVPPHIGTIGWSAAANRLGWSSFLGVPAGSPRVPPGSVPARATDLAGFAPAFIGVGTLDLFVDEDLAFARRLIAAGVPTAVHVTPGAFHAFDFVVPGARVSRAFTAAWQEALRAAFVPG